MANDVEGEILFVFLLKIISLSRQTVLLEATMLQLEKSVFLQSLTQAYLVKGKSEFSQ